jgi:hypothetical protein
MIEKRLEIRALLQTSLNFNAVLLAECFTSEKDCDMLRSDRESLMDMIEYYEIDFTFVN